MKTLSIQKLFNLFLGVFLFAVPLSIWAEETLTIINNTQGYIQFKDVGIYYYDTSKEIKEGSSEPTGMEMMKKDFPEIGPGESSVVTLEKNHWLDFRISNWNDKLWLIWLKLYMREKDSPADSASHIGSIRLDQDTTIKGIPIKVERQNCKAIKENPDANRCDYVITVGVKERNN